MGCPNSKEVTHKSYITERITGNCFVVDTTLSVSMIPQQMQHIPLIASPVKSVTWNNNTVIVFGYSKVMVDFGFSWGTVTWPFLVTNCSEPILGHDFLFARELLFDPAHSRILDKSQLLDHRKRINHHQEKEN